MRVKSTFTICGIVFLLFAGSPCPAQNTFREIEIYRSLPDGEPADSAYQIPTSVCAYSTQSHTTSRDRLSELVRMSETTPAQLRAKIGALERLADRAARKKETDVRLSALTEAFRLALWREPKDYNKAFVLAVRLEKELADVTDDQFPGRREAYVRMGEAYYLFRDYETAVALLSRVIDLKPRSFDHDSRLEALGIVGICYANMPGMMDRSDSCFMAMMLAPEVVRGRPVYRAAALSYLGCNAMIRGEYDKALAFDLEVLPRLKREKNYGHIAGMYACQGFCLLSKGDYAGLRMVIDSIGAYAHRDAYNRNKRLKQAYTLSAKYYSGIGDARTAQLYNDSLVSVYRAEECEYTSQFIGDARRQVGDEEIAFHKQKILKQRKSLLLSLFSTIVLLGTFVVILRLYRKKKEAYEVLSRKANEWAQDSSSAGGAKEKRDPPTDEDHRIMSLVKREMISVCAYREPGLTIESLSERLGVHRNLLSHAVNSTTGGNFKQYLNNFRIREAVKIISENEHKKIYIDELFERVGYTNRTSFYRTFKQFTGLSPAEFQKTNHPKRLSES